MNDLADVKGFLPLSDHEIWRGDEEGRDIVVGYAECTAWIGGQSIQSFQWMGEDIGARKPLGCQWRREQMIRTCTKACCRDAYGLRYADHIHGGYRDAKARSTGAFI